MANAPVYKVTPATLNLIKYQPPLLFPFNFYESAPRSLRVIQNFYPSLAWSQHKYEVYILKHFSKKQIYVLRA